MIDMRFIYSHLSLCFVLFTFSTEGVPLVDTDVNKTSDPKIANIAYGSYALNGEFPYQVALMIYTDVGIGRKRDEFQFCGGSIINERAVLSAAHCFRKSKEEWWLYMKPENFFLRAGTNDAYGRDGDYQDRKVKSIHFNDYDSTTHNGDIVLMMLSEPFDFNERVNRILLPSYIHNFKSGDWCVMSGWGRDEYNVPQEYLKKGYGKIADKQINPLQILVEKDKTRSGDSGGPLVCKGKLTGITSTGIDSENIGYYTNVRYYLLWLDTTWNVNKLENESLGIQPYY